MLLLKVRGEWLLRTTSMLSQPARVCCETQRIRQLPMHSPGEGFDRDMLLPLFYGLDPGDGGEPARGYGAGLSQHATSRSSSRFSSPNCGPHFKPPSPKSV